MRTSLIAYFVALVVFLILDALWLGIFAKDFYQTQLGPLLLAQPRLGVAALFYLMYIAGIVIFCVRPAVDAHSLTHAVVLGALFGLIAYATYDLTNLATLKGWSVMVVAVDILWGAFETALASAISFVVLAYTTP